MTNFILDLLFFVVVVIVVVVFFIIALVRFTCQGPHSIVLNSNIIFTKIFKEL